MSLDGVRWRKAFELGVMRFGRLGLDLNCPGLQRSAFGGTTWHQAFVVGRGCWEIPGAAFVLTGNEGP